MEHDTQPLRAHSDERDVDFVARRNESGATQHSAWNDREANRGGRALSQKLSS
jgi:hypothetical protein